MRATAHAKVNLALRVRGTRPDGYHELRSLAQSIDLADVIEVVEGSGPVVVDDPAVPIDDSNLAKRAIEAVRELVDGPPMSVRLTKRIPTRAGLGGGSADAAAALGLAARRFGVDLATAAELAPSLGSDVPFCFVGGTAVFSGRGEHVDRLPFAGGYALGLVVPPVELSTAAVFAAYARVGPGDPAPPPAATLPPSLRDLAPLGNDLVSAALALAPALGEWRAELSSRWGRPVSMSGSGSSLFAFFTDADEAAAAVDEVPPGSRLAVAAQPVERGWAIES